MQKVALLLLLLQLACISRAQNNEEIRLVGPQSNEDIGHDYYKHLLEIIIEKSLDKYPHRTIAAYHFTQTTQGRSLILLEKGSVDVFWAGTNLEREKRFIPIRIPLFFGLLGYRISIIHRDNLSKFQDLANQPKNIKKLSACQGEHWPDSDILEENGYSVTRISRFESMFTMLANKRCDYFPRAVFEGYGELQQIKKKYPQLIIFDDIVLHYRFPVYFFVNLNAPELAEQIKYGLEKATVDGSVLKLMKTHPMTRQLFPLTRWQEKVFVSLTNKHLPIETPTENKALWLQLQKNPLNQ